MTLYLDLETTGLSATDKVVEIAVVNDENEVCFHTLINPDRSIPERITRLTGLSPANFSASPRLDDVLGELARFSNLMGRS